MGKANKKFRGEQQPIVTTNLQPLKQIETVKDLSGSSFSTSSSSSANGTTTEYKYVIVKQKCW